MKINDKLCKNAKSCFLMITMISLFAVVFLSGCAKTGEYLTDSQVTSSVKAIAGDERIKYVSKNGVSGDRPHYEYCYESEDRTLSFTVNSYPAGEDSFYNPASADVVEYVYAVHAFYEEEVEAEAAKLEDEKGWVAFKNRAELHDICVEVEKIDDIYKQELTYHDAEWLQKYPVDGMAFCKRDDADSEIEFSYTVKIDGSIKADELEQFLCDLYKERTGTDLK